jgi:hypothetical protein
MKAISHIDMLEAAAYALVSERCRASYAHDIRGGLQAVHGAVELLIRAAKSPAENSALAEKASALARRAVHNHEQWLTDLLNRLTLPLEDPSPVNVGVLVGEVLRFIGNDVAKKSLTYRFEPARDIVVLAHANKFRTLILGLCSTLADGLAPESVVDVTVRSSNLDALVELRSVMPCSTIPHAEDLWRSAGATCCAFELLLTLTQLWASDNGGSLELASGAHLPNALRLYYPMVSAKLEAS